MKKIIALTLILISILSLGGCNNNTEDTTAEHEAVSADYGKVIDLAKSEFAEVFKEFENVKIEETATMTRTDNAKSSVYMRAKKKKHLINLLSLNKFNLQHRD